MQALRRALSSPRTPGLAGTVVASTREADEMTTATTILKAAVQEAQMNEEETIKAAALPPRNGLEAVAEVERGKEAAEIPVLAEEGKLPESTMDLPGPEEIRKKVQEEARTQGLGKEAPTTKEEGSPHPTTALPPSSSSELLEPGGRLLRVERIREAQLGFDHPRIFGPHVTHAKTKFKTAEQTSAHDRPWLLNTAYALNHIIFSHFT